MAKYEIEKEIKVTEQIEIDSCCFCTSDNVTVVYSEGEYGYSARQAYVKCKSCGATGPSTVNETCSLPKDELIKRAIAKWNNRK